MPFYFNEQSGRGISINNQMAAPKGPGWKSYPSIDYYNNMVKNQSGVNSLAANSAAADLPQTDAGGIDFAAVRDRLAGNQEKAFEAGSADINQQAYQASQLSQSNLIGAGLAGTTVVGGEQVGIGDAANRAKAALSGRLQDKTDALNLGYAGLQQAATEGQAERDTAVAKAGRGSITPRSPSSATGAPTSGTGTSTQPAKKSGSGASRMGYTSKGVFSPELLAIQQAQGFTPHPAMTAPTPSIDVAGKNLSISQLSTPGEDRTARNRLLSSNFAPTPTAGPMRR